MSKSKKKPANRVEEIDQELEVLEEQRLSAKEAGKKLNEEKRHLMMIEQITSRLLTTSPMSVGEMDWIEANPKEWKKIKEETKDKRGSRKAQVAKAGVPA